ncbi:unnamed protein product [Dibothriocephalus latus]|uniref:Uncharacterized protein n=1 Tax=Dibothriocephalus latus TaxID=60516 RepID=A0A3P7LYG2_DIBLA|nr:unnamed protein product [Dibothriocephalus latus]
MNEDAVKIHAVTQPEQKRLIPLDSSSEASSLPSIPEGMALTEELCSLDWLQTENLLPGTIMPARKTANQKPLVKRACLQTVFSAGCVHSLDERINEDLHPLSWLQDSNLLPISPIDEEEEEDLPLSSTIQASSTQRALEFSKIWEWCKNSFPAYDIGSRLKACLRHILSSNASFQRVPQALFGTENEEALNIPFTYIHTALLSVFAYYASSLLSFKRQLFFIPLKVPGSVLPNLILQPTNAKTAFAATIYSTETAVIS